MNAEIIDFEMPIYSFHIDSNQNVSNIVFIQWMEVARIRLMEAVGLPISNLTELGFLGIITETCIKYHKPLVLGDTVRIQLWISKLRSASATLSFRFLRADDELVAEGKQEALFVSDETGKPHRPTPHQRKLFKRFTYQEFDEKKKVGLV